MKENSVFHNILPELRLLAVLCIIAVILYSFVAGVFPKIASAKERAALLAKRKRPVSALKADAGAKDKAKIAKTITLADAIQIAMEKNYSLIMKRARIEEKEAIFRRMETGYLPKFNMVSLYHRWDDEKFTVFNDQRSGTGMGPYDTYDYSVGLAQTIYDGGMTEAEVGKAKAVLEGVENEYEIERINLTYDITKAFYSALRTVKDLDFRKSLLEEKTKNLEVTKNLLSEGAILRRDLLKANVELGQARYALKKAEDDKNLSMMNLKSKLGLDLSSGIEIDDDPVLRNMNADLENLLLKALQDGPVVKKLHADVRTAEKEVDKAESGFMRPKLILEGKYGYVNDRPTPENKYWMIGCKVTFPVFDGGQALAEIQEAKAVLKQAKAGEKEFTSQLEIDIRSAFARVQELKEMLPVMEESVRQARENLRVENDIYEEGLELSLEVLKAENLLKAVEVDYLASVYDYNLAVAALECAMGEKCDQGYDEKFQNILENKPTEPITVIPKSQ